MNSNELIPPHFSLSLFYPGLQIWNQMALFRLYSWTHSRVYDAMVSKWIVGIGKLVCIHYVDVMLCCIGFWVRWLCTVDLAFGLMFEKWGRLCQQFDRFQSVLPFTQYFKKKYLFRNCILSNAFDLYCIWILHYQ